MRSKIVKLSSEQEEHIGALYKDGYGSTYLGKLFSVSSSRIWLILNKNNIPKNNNKYTNSLSEEDKASMIKMYLDGITLEGVSKKFNVCKNTVKTTLNNRGIKCRKTKDVLKTSFDKMFFLTKSDRLAYFYGFVLGDGTYSDKNIAKIKIAVNSKDVSILENFCHWMTVDASHLFHYKNTRCVEFYIRDNIIKRDKKYWGVIENKTYNPIIPQIKNKKLLRYFLIGLIDADGHIVYGNNKGGQFQLVGNKKIMQWFISSINNLGYSGQIVHRTYEDKVWSRVCIYNKKDVMNLSKVLRVNECDFLLGRKWNNVKNAA